jgi:hypothetical protein
MAIIGLSFHGPINHPATTKLRNALCGFANERLTEGPNAGKRRYAGLYLFMNSLGGQVDDGLSLFGLIRSLPLEVTTINVGMVASAAIITFLAGKENCISQFHFPLPRLRVELSGSAQPDSLRVHGSHTNIRVRQTNYI